MTVIIEPMRDTARGSGIESVRFRSEGLRESFDGTGTITASPVTVYTVNGILTTPDLDPGPTVAKVLGETRLLDVPDSGVPIRFWPLWDAAAPTPTDTADGFVRNAGGLARVQVITESQYTSLLAPDPNTVYILFPD